MKKTLVGFPAALLLALIFSLACAGQQPQGPSASLPMSMFSDIPLAPELGVDEKNSQVYNHQVGQIGSLKASGPIKEAQLLDFYRAIMPANGWERLGEFEMSSGRLMVFGKTPRSAAIVINEGWVNSSVEINVSAKK